MKNTIDTNNEYEETKTQYGDEEERLYAFMVSMYEDFITSDNIAEEELIKEIQDNDTALDISIGSDVARFVIIKTNEDLPQRLVELGNVKLKDVNVESEEPVPEAYLADFIATVLYDKSVGEDSSKNICRTKNQVNIFGRKLKEVMKKSGYY